MNSIEGRYRAVPAFIAAILPIVSLSNGWAQERTAQPLEEVVVTAQRREQALLEVPISLEAWSGAELRTQGIRTMDDLANFSPSVEIDIRTQDQDISIRGVGTTGNNLTLEQAAPTFVDGVYFGRTSMIKTAFVDLERIEVLRGPQPVYFGQNATAGAFSLTTRKPSREWQGDATVEIGNYGRQSFEGGFGGPLTDTVGIRVAAKWDELEGYMTDIVTGQKFPQRKDVVGRVILQWEPSEQFEATFKYEDVDTQAGSDGNALCLTDGEPEGVEADFAIPGVSVFTEQVDIIPMPSKCFTNKGVAEGLVFYAPPTDLRQQDARSGILDIREVGREVRNGDIKARDDTEFYNTYLNLGYTFQNGIRLTSLTGFVDYYRDYLRDNGGSPFLTNQRNRVEDLTSTSQEVRLISPGGGAVEWSIGAYWQKEDLDLISDTIRANVRRPRRYNNAWQDAEWLSAFGTLTFNFMDDKAAIDLGGRFTEVEKTGFIEGLGARWLFDIPTTDPDVEEVSPGIYTMPWRSRSIPDEWNGQAPVGIEDLDPTIRRTPGPYFDKIDDSQFDPQVTLRYRPSDDTAFYVRYAEAFKAGGFDTGASSLADSLEEFSFLPEYATNYELGMKTNFWEGRARANVSLFHMEVKDLQIATTDLSSGSVSTNAGKQRVQGVEFDVTAAVNEWFTASLVGALMDGEMVEYTGAGCTDAEEEAGLCDPETETIDRSGSPAPRTPDYKFTLKLDYWMPVNDSHRITFKGNFAFSDGYIDDVEGFEKVVMWDAHEDINLSIGFGDIDGVWNLSLWGRNLTESQPEYFPQYDVNPDGRQSKNLSLGDFRTYGVQFQYNYR